MSKTRLMSKNMWGKTEACLDNKRYAFFILLLVVFAFKLSAISQPYMGDAKFWYVPKSLLIAENNFNPVFYDKGLPDALIVEGFHWDKDSLDDFSHPPLFYEILALVYFLFGYSVEISHVVVFLFSFLAVYFTYLIGRKLADPVVGFCASLLLFFSPMFFSQSSDLTPAVSVTALILASFYFAINKNYKWYLIAGSAAVLIKETGIAVIFASMFYVFLQERDKGLKTALLESAKYSIPLLVFAWWVIFHYQQTSLLIRSENIEAGSNFLSGMARMIKFIFLDQYRFILSGLLVFSLFKKNKLRIEHYAAIFLIVEFLIFFSYTPMKHARHILPIFPFFFIWVLSISTFLKRKLIIAITIILIVLSVLAYHSETSYELDENYRFSDIVNSKIEAIEFLEENYADSKIWVDGYSFPDFVYSYAGFVDEPLNAHRMPIQIYNFENKEFTSYFQKGDIIVENRLISYDWKPEYRKIDLLDLNLIKEIRYHNDFIKIYEVMS